MKQLFIAFLLLVIAQPSFAADANGHYWLGSSTGNVACTDFVAAMEKARRLNFGSLVYLEELQGFDLYLEGFRSGYNVAATDTCDVFAGEKNNSSLLALAESWCRAHPTEHFGDAVVALSKERYPKRQKMCAE